MLQIMDSYAPSYALLVAGLAEVLAISYVYGKCKSGKNKLSALVRISTNQESLSCLLSVIKYKLGKNKKSSMLRISTN